MLFDVNIVGCRALAFRILGQEGRQVDLGAFHRVVLDKLGRGVVALFPERLIGRETQRLWQPSATFE